METTKEKIVEMDTGLNDYIDVGTTRVWMSLTNWRTVEEPNKKNPDDRPFIKFKADVFKYGDSKTLLNVCGDKPKLFETTHVDFRKKINEILKTKVKSDAVLIGAKVVGTEGKKVLYDIEQ